MKEQNRGEQVSLSQENVCTYLMLAGSIKFGDFSLNLHQYSPDAPKSPIYIDVKRLRRFPEGTKIGAKPPILDAYEEVMSKLKFDLIADVPSGATFLVSSLSDRLRKGMISPRLDQKSYGSGANIDGFTDEDKGKRVLLIDDVLTRGISVIRAAGVLRHAGLIVEDVVVLVDREQGGERELGKAGLELHSIITLDKMLKCYIKSGEIDLDKYHEIRRRLDSLR